MSADAPRDLLERAEEALHPLSAIRGWDRENLFQLIRALCQRVRAAESERDRHEKNYLAWKATAEESGRLLKSQCDLEAESARLREALRSAISVAKWASEHGLIFSGKAADEWEALVGRPSEPRT